MITSTSPHGHTVLQLMLARRMFIGDEVRIASLRSAWVESGQEQTAFADAISLLREQGLIRIANSKAGPVAQLTKSGFSTGSQPHLERRKTPQPAAEAPPARRRRVEHLSPKASHAVSAPLPRPAETAAAPQAQSMAARSAAAQPLASSTQTRRKQARQDSHSARSKVTHAGVFGQSRGPSSNALQLCVLGLMRNRKMRANGQIDYAEVLQEWLAMDLRHDDLLLAVKRLTDRGELVALSRPRERLMLTKSGFDRYERPASDIDEGMDRWWARKYLRVTKRLGTMPAA